MQVYDDNGVPRERRAYEDYDEVYAAYQRFPFPVCVTLLGSTSFVEEFRHFQEKLTLACQLVYPISGKGHDDGLKLSEEKKLELMAFTFWKILHSDYVLVINAIRRGVPDYIGPSTENEIIFARKHNIPVRFAYEHTCKADCPCSRNIICE